MADSTATHILKTGGPKENRTPINGVTSRYTNHYTMRPISFVLLTHYLLRSTELLARRTVYIRSYSGLTFPPWLTSAKQMTQLKMVNDCGFTRITRRTETATNLAQPQR